MAVEFNEEVYQTYQSESSKGLTGFLVKKNIASSDKQARTMLIVVAFLAIILMIGILIFSGNETEIPDEFYT